MKRKKNGKGWLGGAAMLLLTGILCILPQEVEAAGSYSNAREFFESTGADGCHAEVYGGTIYYATQAKLASSPSNLKYGTVGYDIHLSGGGQTIEFGVKRVEDGSAENGSMREVAGSRVDWNGYRYNLYSVPRSELEALAYRANAAAAEVVLKSADITVRIHAIMTTKQNGTMHGGVTEDGTGGLTEWGTVYHLKDQEQRKALQSVFRGHTFLSFFNVERMLHNYCLSLRYKLNGGVVKTGGYGVKEDFLQKGQNPVVSQARIMNQIKLIRTDQIGLQKAGYHIVPGQEWICEGRCLNQEIFYWPGDLAWDVIESDVKLVAAANWKPNRYRIQYEANGGSGRIQLSQLQYGDSFSLQEGFTRKGYQFLGYAVVRTSKEGERKIRCKSGWKPWETAEQKPDEWKLYQTNGHQTMNQDWISGSETDTFVFYAQWNEQMVRIQTDQQGGSGGTERFYLQYQVGWYADQKGTKEIAKIQLPTKNGYRFLGYYTSVKGQGKQVADEQGKLLLKALGYFTKDSTVYACWEPASYTLIFDKQGGRGGMNPGTEQDRVKVSYQGSLPKLAAPIREGYEFRGYFTEKNGRGTVYYSDGMAPMRRYQERQDRTIYAYWVDRTAPEAALTAEPAGWSRQSGGVKLTVAASDRGSGLSMVELYQDGVRVAQKTGLGGAKQHTLVYYDQMEGALPFQAVVTDLAGNQSEARTAGYYDVTPPKGQVVEGAEHFSGTSLEVEFFVTDYKVK